MLGITDSLFCIYRKSKRFNETFRRYNIRQPGSLTWVCFLPWRVGIKDAKRLGFVPKNGNVIAYEMPDDILSADPKLTLRSVNEMGRDLDFQYTKEGLFEKKTAFLGISAGALPAIYFANKYPSDKLIAVCPTYRLGEGIFTAFAARKIKKKSIEKGYNAKSYDTVICDINPENNIRDLPDDITIYLSRFDKFVPYAGGMKLVKKLRKGKKKVVLRKFNFFGHMPVLYFFGKEKIENMVNA